MFAENLTETLLKVLQRPELKVLAPSCYIQLDPSIGLPFQVDQSQGIILGAPCLGEESVVAFHLRHALELAVLLKNTAPSVLDITKITLMAARTTARCWSLDSVPESRPPESWVRVFSDAQSPALSFLQEISPTLCSLLEVSPDLCGSYIVRLGTSACLVERCLASDWTGGRAYG